MSGKTLSPSQLAQYIDHTLLRPDAKEDEIRKAVGEAIEHQFKGVCVEGKWVELVAKLLQGTPVLTVTVVSFPKGDEATSAKAEEARIAVSKGAKEVDMVLNRHLLKQRRLAECSQDILRVVEAARVPVKVILETSELTDEEKVIASSLALGAGAQFIKTSTGFSKSGATVEDVKLMRSIAGETLGVKASGGIRSYPDALKMIAAGATRLGTSASVAIVKGAEAGGKGY